MPSITNTFYPLIHLRNAVPDEEEFYRMIRESEINIDDKHQDYTVFGLSSCLYQGNAYGDRRWVTSDAMNQLEEVVKDFREFSDLFPLIGSAMDSVRHGSVTITTQHRAATEDEKKIISILDDYANLVAASHYAAGHGKSWEPLLSLRMQDDQMELSLRSYQAGDDFSVTGTAHEVTTQLSSHVESVKGRLLCGSTNSNPLVMSMIGENEDEAHRRYQMLTEDEGFSYKETLLSEGIFLPSVFNGNTVESAGYPDVTYSPARVEYRDEQHQETPDVTHSQDKRVSLIYPVLHLAVGFDQLY